MVEGVCVSPRYRNSPTHGMLHFKTSRMQELSRARRLRMQALLVGGTLAMSLLAGEEKKPKVPRTRDLHRRWDTYYNRLLMLAMLMLVLGLVLPARLFVLLETCGRGRRAVRCCSTTVSSTRRGTTAPPNGPCSDSCSCTRS